MSEKVVIQLETLTRLADGFRESRGITGNLTTEQMIALAQEPIKPEQEKIIEITKNGATEIFPDDGYTLSKVTANVNVAASGENKLAQLADKTITEVTAEDLEGVTIIKDSMFSYCKNLINVVIPDSVVEMGRAAFGWSEIENLTIGSGIVRTRQGAFQDANNKNIYYNGNIESWCKISFEDGAGSPLSKKYGAPYANFYIKNLKEEYEPLIELVIPNSINEIKNYTFANFQSLTKVIIPSTVTSIGERAFANCKNLADLIIENGVQSISSAAFYASGITSIVMPDSVTETQSSLFYQCENLTQATLSNNLNVLKGSTFYGCKNLTTLTIPANVTEILGQALHIGYRTTELKATIKFLGTTPPTIATNTFNASYLNKIIVPKGCGEAYKAATNWANFADYIEEATE